MTTAVAPAEVHATNPALLELDPELRQAYAAMLLALADSDLVIGHRHSEWTGFAPSAEEDVAFSSIAQDELGHAHLYYALVTGADDEEAVDRLALDRGPRAFRHLPLLHAPNGDWFFTIARHVYWDAYEAILLQAAVQSDLPLLGGAARRVLNEEQYHLEHAVDWLALLSSAERPRDRLARQLLRVVEIGGNPADRLPGLVRLGHRGHLPEPADLKAAFAASVADKLATAGWPASQVRAVDRALNARPWESPSPPGLYQLHRDLTGLRRAHAGASW